MTKTCYLVRSTVNSALILCTDGEFHPDALVGPGRDWGAKVYKTYRGASAVRGGNVIVRSIDERGVES